MQDLILLNKPKCLTPLEAIRRLKIKRNISSDEKMSYAGRLDPMAQGLLIILHGELNKKRKDFEKLTKTYEFTIILGIKTDTYDQMGKILAVKNTPIDLESKIVSEIPYFLQKKSQPYPPYSSKAVQGKPLFYWARSKQLNKIEIPHHPIVISDFSLLSLSRQSKKNFIKNIIQQISSVQGDFRQNQIIADWEKLMISAGTGAYLTTATLRATVSSGTYIRSIINELGERIGCFACAFDIKRTAVGDMSLSDAISFT